MVMPYSPYATTPYAPASAWGLNRTQPPMSPELPLTPYMQGRLSTAFNQTSWGNSHQVSKVYDNDYSGTPSIGDSVVLTNNHYGWGGGAYWGHQPTTLSMITAEVSRIAGLGYGAPWYG